MERVGLYLQDVHNLRGGLDWVRDAGGKGFGGGWRGGARVEREGVHGRRRPRRVPIVIGAVGGNMLELAGEIADGVLLNYCVPVEYNDTALERLEAGAHKAGRSLDAVDRYQLVVCSVDHDRKKALECSRGLITQYLAQQPHIAEASGVSKDVVAEIQSILGWPATREQIERAQHLVSDELVQRITASGTPEEARAKVDEYRRRGATCPILYDVCGDPKLLIDTFSPTP